jgi:hypothetical protein
MEAMICEHDLQPVGLDTDFNLEHWHCRKCGLDTWRNPPLAARLVPIWFALFAWAVGTLLAALLVSGLTGG